MDEKYDITFSPQQFSFVKKMFYVLVGIIELSFWLNSIASYVTLDTQKW